MKVFNESEALELYHMVTGEVNDGEEFVPFK